MFKRTQLCVAALTAIAGATAWAQDAQDTTTPPVQRVEITGSSIKRIDAEGALPVITLNRAAIAQSGAVTAAELIQALPSMQGFTGSQASINGGGGGTTTASLHDIGDAYTLVLLNGRRIASFGTGSTVNLEQLPLSAIERVEILTDGASALYGADAVAGVVNFITKQGGSDGSVDLSFSKPQHGGGREVQFSLSKGFGDLDSDGFTLLASAGFTKIDAIWASQRPFSRRGGVFPFTHQGTNYLFYSTSGNANPPNVDLYDEKFNDKGSFNPMIAATGGCGTDPNAYMLGSQCRFNYAATVQAQPASQNANLFLSGKVKINDAFNLFGEAMLGRASMTGRFAPPAQVLLYSVGDPIYDKYVTPYLAGLGQTTETAPYAVFNMRVVDAGPRSDENIFRATHLVGGVEGSLGGFDVTASYTHSVNNMDSQFAGGYTSQNRMDELIASGAWDPFAQGTDASRAAFAPAILKGSEGTSRASLDVLSARLSGPLFKSFSGKDAYLGAGFDLTRQGYFYTPAPIFVDGYPDYPVGSGQGAKPFDSSRSVRGVFGELLVPITKEFEVSAALRYDSYTAVTNDRNFDPDGAPLPSAVQGNAMSSPTYKLSARFQPMSELLVRASFGTGFRAPSMGDITSPLTGGGVTGAPHMCPAKAPDPNAVGCSTSGVATQYNVQSGGNPLSGPGGLKPEHSKQWTLGFQVEPSSNWSLGLDFWNVRINDVITSVPENTAFSNYETYKSLFIVAPDPATGVPSLTLLSYPINGAAAGAAGYDWDVLFRDKLADWGSLSLQWRGTYLFNSWQDSGFGSGVESSMGRIGSNDAVSFRVLSTVTASLKTGAFTNALTWHYRPGYKDQTYTADDGIVYLQNPDGSRGDSVDSPKLSIPAQNTFDYQGRWDYDKSLSLTFGIRNLLDKQPPMSIKSVAGNMLGFDPRYADGVGRTFYLKGEYKF